MQNIRSVILTFAATGLFAVVAVAQGDKGHEEAASSSEVSPPPRVDTVLVVKRQVFPVRVTVVGQVIDVSCFLRNHMDHSADHTVCANLCLAQGLPLGILDVETGQIHLIFLRGHRNPTETMAERVGKAVKATGWRYSYSGLKGIEVQEVEPVKDQDGKQ